MTAKSTGKVYARRWARFVMWCQERRLTPLPCRAETLADYVSHLVDKGKTRPVIFGELTAITAMHKQVGANCPRGSLVNDALPKANKFCACGRQLTDSRATFCGNRCSHKKHYLYRGRLVSVNDIAAEAGILARSVYARIRRLGVRPGQCIPEKAIQVIKTKEIQVCRFCGKSLRAGKCTKKCYVERRWFVYKIHGENVTALDICNISGTSIGTAHARIRKIDAKPGTELPVSILLPQHQGRSL